MLWRMERIVVVHGKKKTFVVAGERTTTQVVKSGNKSRQFYAGWRKKPL